MHLLNQILVKNIYFIFQSKISEHKKVDEKVQAALKDDTVELEVGLEACDQALKGFFLFFSYIFFYLPLGILLLLFLVGGVVLYLSLSVFLFIYLHIYILFILWARSFFSASITGLWNFQGNNKLIINRLVKKSSSNRSIFPFNVYSSIFSLLLFF